MCLTAPWERDRAAPQPRIAHHPCVATLGAGRWPAEAVGCYVGPDRYDRQVFHKAHALPRVRAADESREAWEWLVKTLPALAEGDQVAPIGTVVGWRASRRRTRSGCRRSPPFMPLPPTCSPQPRRGALGRTDRPLAMLWGIRARGGGSAAESQPPVSGRERVLPKSGPADPA